MHNQWVRLWLDMPNDSKWRTIARVSGESIGNVIAIYIHMMTMAANADEGGRTQGRKGEDVATALDISEISKGTAAVYLMAWQEISARHGIRRFGSALWNVLRRSDSFPLPKAIKEECEIMRRDSRNTKKDKMEDNRREIRSQDRPLELPSITQAGIAQHGARFNEIRATGFVVVNETDRHNGVVRSRYRLTFDPESEVR